MIPEADDSAHSIRFKFPGKERLKNRSGFAWLISKGKYVRSGDLVAVYVTNYPDEWLTSRLMVAFAVPKRRFKRAVDRNLLKRRLKEAYRLNKHLVLPMLEQNNISLVFLVKYASSEIHSAQQIQDEFRGVFRRLNERIASGNSQDLSAD